MLTKTLHSIAKIENNLAESGQRRVWLFPTSIREARIGKSI